MALPTDARPQFYGRRNARAPRAKRRAMVTEHLPRLALPDPFSLPDPIDPNRFFTTARDQIWMEIGFGGGEHLAGQAERNRDVNMIGCEPFMDGVGSMVRHATERHLDNVRLLCDDSRPLLYRLKPASLDRAFLLFPDPWPKTRHAGRRFITRRNLNALAAALKAGAEFRVASDHMPYIAWTLRHVMAHPDFEWRAERPDDWRRRPDDWVATRYEQKALRQGKPCVYLSFYRKPGVRGQNKNHNCAAY